METKRCGATVYRDNAGKKLDAPRPCKQNALVDGDFCAIHSGRRVRLGSIRDVVVHRHEGGFCVWCGQPAARFAPSGERVEISLCGAHARGLARVIMRS